MRREEVESLQVVEILDAGVQTTVDEHPVAKYCATVVATSGQSPVHVVDFDLLGQVGRVGEVAILDEVTVTDVVVLALPS